MKATIVCLVACLALASAQADPSIVQTPDGAVRGVIAGPVRRFLGIPFAVPPLDELRWQPPVQVKPWTHIQDATKAGPECMQEGPDGSVIGSEDCLYLNVFAPIPANASVRYPVMLFIHGGGYDSGSAVLFDGQYLVGDQVVANGSQVVLVVLQYRLSAFGFLGSEALRAADGSTGNFGLQDQRLAMQWIQRNIAAFNGDAGNVMIFGESAGAGSVSCHLVMTRSQGLFHKAAMESGSFSPWIAQQPERAEATFNHVAAFLNCTGTSAQIVNCMRKASASSLVLSLAALPPTPWLRYAPVIDGVELEAHPVELLALGALQPMPILLGSNRDEGTMFIRNITDEQSYEMLMNFSYGALAPRIIQQYAALNYSTYFDDAAHISGDSGFNCPARYAAQVIANRTSDVFVYFFQHPIAAFSRQSPPLGCFHSSELYFVFNNKPLLTADEEALALQFGNFWTNFAATGNPNGAQAGLVQWPRYNQTSDEVLVLDLPSSFAASGVKKDICDFWASISP